jgi:predicted thioredoxin/glutaredoxin
MAYINIDIDLDEFDTDELVQELCSRMEANVRFKQGITSEHKEKLKKQFSIMYAELFDIKKPMISSKTLEDQIKHEVIISVWDKYSAAELEEKLK